MFATIPGTVSNTKYKYSKESTANMKAIFGNVVKKVFVQTQFQTDVLQNGVGANGDWSGTTILVEFSNGRIVSMSNSEWASFDYEKDVKIS